MMPWKNGGGGRRFACGGKRRRAEKGAVFPLSALAEQGRRENLAASIRMEICGSVQMSWNYCSFLNNRQKFFNRKK